MIEGKKGGAVGSPVGGLRPRDGEAVAPPLMHRLAARALAADASGGSGHWPLTAALAAVLLAIVMIPIHWTGNEINYFDLSLRFVRPESLSPLHATYDASNARFLSFTILGFFIDHLGFETAHVVLGLVFAGVLGLAFAYMADTIGFSRGESLVGLGIFLALKQTVFGHEWIFGGVEAKTFAYAAVFVAIACAWKGRSLRAVGLAALATYFHFLVGGFWGAAIVLLIAIRAGSLRRAVVPLTVYSVLVLPMFVLLLREEMIGAAAATLHADLSPDQIYSQLRNYRLVAPFLSTKIFLHHWLGGSIVVLATVVALAARLRKPRAEPEHLTVWVLALSAYLLVALVAAWFDRHTYFLGPFYCFRPAALTLLLGLMALLRWSRGCVGGVERQRWVALVAAVALVCVAVPRLGVTVYKSASGRRLPIEHALDAKQRELVDWVRGNTAPASVVLVGPWSKLDVERRMPWVALEHLFGRPTLVNFKFVPTRKDQIAAWYQLLLWRKAVYAGDCTRLAEHHVDYLVVLEPEAVARLSACGQTVWSNGAYAVLRNAAPADAG